MASAFRLAAIAVVLLAWQGAQAQVYTTNLSGAIEAPPNESPGTGTARVDVDPVARTFRLRTEFSGLLSTVTAAHIHGPTAVALDGTAGVMTQVPSFVGFPLGGTSGNYDETFDMTLSTTWNPAFVTASGGTAADAEAAFLAALAEGKTYLNIHTSQFPGGEIRGFLVPEPTTLLLLPMAGMFLLRRSGRRA